MKMYTLNDLRQQGATYHYIIQQLLQRVPPQEGALTEPQQLKSGPEEYLDALEQQGCLALISQTQEKEIVGYALLGQSKNDWTGYMEGWVYALGMEEVFLDSPLMHEFLQAIRTWAKKQNCLLMRTTVSDIVQDQALLRRLSTDGWMASCLIYNMILAPLDHREPVLLPEVYDNIRIRPANEDDYPFTMRLISLATWHGLSPLEKSLIHQEKLAENVCRDFGQRLYEGSLTSFVAEHSQEGTCGHITMQHDTMHILGIKTVNIVDTEVIPAFRDLRVTNRLVQYALATCQQEEGRLVSSSIGLEGTPPERVLLLRQQLERYNWYLSSRVLYLPIGCASSRVGEAESGQSLPSATGSEVS